MTHETLNPEDYVEHSSPMIGKIPKVRVTVETEVNAMIPETVADIAEANIADLSENSEIQ